MLTRDQAMAIADEILQQAHLAKLENENQYATHIPFLYRCHELRALAPWMRIAVVLQAKKAVARNYLLIILSLMWVCGIALFWFLNVRGTDYSKYVGFISIFCWVFPVFGRSVVIRHEVRKISKELRSAFIS